MFDPYRKWLGIPPECRPPTHYQLLGISPDERDLEVIDAAVLRQSAYVRNFQAGKYGDHATRILNEIAEARICLMDQAKRAAYDAGLDRNPTSAAHQTPPAGADTVSGIPNVAPPPEPAAAVSRGIPAAAPRPPRPAAPRPAPRRPLPPPMDLDSLASQAGLSGRRRATRVTLPSRKQSGMPAYYWQIPLGAGALLAVVIIALAVNRSSRSHLPEQAEADAGALNAGALDQPLASDLGEDESAGGLAGTDGPDLRTTPDSRLPGLPAAPFDQPGSAVPTLLGDSNMRTAEAADALTASETNVGSPTAFPDETDGGKSTVSLPVPARDPLIVFAAAGKPLAAIGQTVYDLKSGETVGKTGAFQAHQRDALRTLSADGKFYAAADATDSLRIEVRSCESGDFLFSIPLEGSFVKLTLLEFVEPGALVASARFGNGQRVQLWEPAEGQLLKEFFVEPFERSQATLSRDGRLLAVVDEESQILVYDLTQEPERSKSRPMAKIPLPPDQLGAVAVDGLQFSPAGDELLAVLHGGARIQAWTVEGEPTFTHHSGVDMRAVWTGACVYEGPAIEWHPGERGWLLSGHFFFDRDLGRVIWMLQTDRDPDARMHFVNADRLMTLRSDGINRKLADITIPWDRIDQSLLAVHGDQPAHLGPRDDVSLDVRVSRVAGGAEREEVRAEIERMVAARLRAENVSISPQRPARLRVSYEESQDSRAAKIETQGEMKLHLSVNSGAQEVWTAGILAAAVEETSEMSPAKRAELYWRLSTRLHQTPMPYFIPKSAELTSLPAIIRP
jgi:hypothetical protein